MAAAKKVQRRKQARRTKPVRQRAQNGNGVAPPKRRRATTAESPDIGAEAVRHLVRAPADYAGVVRQFADALTRTNFKGEISAFKIRTLLRRGERLAQRAATAEHKAVIARRQRTVHDSNLWKDVLATWRLVGAAMPNHPELETPFAFMQEYMSIGRRNGPPSTPPAA